MRRLVLALALILLGVSVAVAGQLTPADVQENPQPDVAVQTVRADDSIPLHDWVPAVANFSTPKKFDAATNAADPSPMVPMTPCRVVDTRYGSGSWGPPMLTAGTARVFNLRTNLACPGIPSTVTAYSVNVTVTNPSTSGWLTVWPYGASEPTVSTLNFLAGETVANAAIIPAGTSGQIYVKSPTANTHVIIDVNGYYRDGTAVSEGTAVIENRTLVSGYNYIYPSTSTVTLPNGGQCQVTAITQIRALGARTGETLWFRIAVDRAGTNTYDSYFGFYNPGLSGAGLAPAMTRTLHIDMSANQATRFGCFLSVPTQWVNDTADCLVSWTCL